MSSFPRHFSTADEGSGAIKRAHVPGRSHSLRCPSTGSFCAARCYKKQLQRPKPTNSLTCMRNNKMSSLSETVLQHAGANPVAGLNSVDGAGNTVKTNLTWIITSVGYLCLPFFGTCLVSTQPTKHIFIPFSHPLVLMPDFCPSATNYMPTLINKDGFRKFRRWCVVWQAFSCSKTPPFLTFSCM